MNKVIFLETARPNFIKIAPIVNEAKKHVSFDCYLLHTWNYYDKDVSSNTVIFQN